MSTTQRRATLATVAASAGVSVATVSKVLNGRQDVAPATRARVQDLLRAHDYAGRIMPIERLPTYELTFRGKVGGYSAEIIQGVAETAEELGVSVTVGVKVAKSRARTRAEIGEWARALAFSGRRGVIAVTDRLGRAEVEALRRVRVPLVVIDPMNTPTPDVVSVGSTNFNGGQAAGRHLVQLGHTRIGYLGCVTAECIQARLGGFRNALDAARIAVPEHLHGNAASFDFDDGLLVARQLLDLSGAADSHLRGQRRARARCDRGRPGAGALSAGGPQRRRLRRHRDRPDRLAAADHGSPAVEGDGGRGAAHRPATRGRREDRLPPRGARHRARRTSSRRQLRLNNPPTHA